MLQPAPKKFPSDPQTTQQLASRRVIHGDALALLPTLDTSSAAIVTSLPDVTELGIDRLRWRRWFVDAAALCVRSVGDAGVVVFCQTDVRANGLYVDKATLVIEGASAAGAALLSRHTVARRPPGFRSTGRTSTMQLVVVGAARRLSLPWPVPDILLDESPANWVRGMSNATSDAAIRLSLHAAPAITTIVDPFCGRGAILDAAGRAGLASIGIELNHKRAALCARAAHSMLSSSTGK